MVFLRETAPPNHSGGMALIAVLWIVAALSIMISGVQTSVRGEIRIVSSGRQVLEAVALGEAGMYMALQDLSANKERLARRSARDYAYAGRSMSVEIIPLNGLIDLNEAPADLLAALFAHAGGVSSQQASVLANDTVQYRTQRDLQGRVVGFESVQDLLSVPGVDYNLYARLSPLLTADLQGSGRVNPLAAPVEVLAVLAGGDRARVAAVFDRQSTALSASDIDLTGLNGQWVGIAATTRYRVQVLVPTLDGSSVMVIRHVDTRPDRFTGIPWRIFNAEHWMVAPQ